MRASKAFADEASCWSSDDSTEASDSDSNLSGSFIVDDLPPKKRSKFIESLPPKKKRVSLARSSRVISSDTESVEDVLVTPTPKPRGRPRGPKKTIAPVIEKQPGHSTFPVGDWSITVSKVTGDVSRSVLDQMAKFGQDHCIKSCFSTEVGPRAHNLHIQGCLRINYPTNKEHRLKLGAFIKKLLPNNGKGHRVVAKPFATDQNFSAMIGYCMKDQGQAHFEVVFHNITTEEKARGTQDRDFLLTSFDDNKKILTMKNILQEAYRFNMRALYPVIAPPQFVVLYMIQSSNYIFSPDFISTYQGMNLEELSAMWRMIFKPEDSTMQMVQTLLFRQLRGPNIRTEFFIAGQQPRVLVLEPAEEPLHTTVAVVPAYGT